MKTTFDLPEPLLRRAKAAAAHQGRPLRDLVAEALTEKLRAPVRGVAPLPARAPSAEWKAFEARLIRQPDGSYFNPEGIEDERFFEVLESLRSERLGQQAPRESLPVAATASAPAARRSRKPR